MRITLAALFLLAGCQPVTVAADAATSDARRPDAPVLTDAPPTTGYVACDECVPLPCAGAAPECTPAPDADPSTDCSLCAALCGRHGEANYRLTVTCGSSGPPFCEDTGDVVMFCYRFLG